MQQDSNGPRLRRRPNTISQLRRSSLNPLTTIPRRQIFRGRTGRQKLSEAESALELQYHDLEQQREAAELGMWIFLMTELLLFGGLFAAYTIYRISYPQAFVAGSHELSTPIGTINTAVLLISSFGVALAMRGAKIDGRKRLIGGLALAWILGVVFLVLKGYEYYDHYQHHQVPGLNWAWNR